MVTAEWKSAPDFAEFAEALGVKTTQIVTAMVTGDVAGVIYSPDDGDHERVVLIGLGRDSDGVYQVVNAPAELPGFFDTIREHVEQTVKDLPKEEE